MGGEIRLYSAISELEHGPAFHTPGTGRILILSLREDGFISLKTKDPELESNVATREKIWHGGNLHVNIKARRATLAIYSTMSENQDMNILGHAEPIEGFSHSDCVEFSGDSTDWVPEFKSGRRLDELVGRTLVFEVKFTDGEIFSLSGDYTDIFNVEGAVYRRYGVLRL